MALTDAERLQMTALAMMQHNIHYKGGGGGDTGEFIQDGIWLRIDPNYDNVTTDDGGNITSYTFKDRPRTAPFLARVGTNMFKEVGTAAWTPTGDDAVTYYATSDSRKAWVTKSRYGIPDDVDITVEVKTDTAAQLATILFCYDLSVSDTNFKCYMAGWHETSLMLRVYKGTAASVTYTAPFTWATNTWYKIRAQKIGTTVRCKAWLASDTEPSGWAISITDSTYTGGGVGFYSYYSGTVNYRNLVFNNWNGYSLSGSGTILQEPTVNNGLKRIAGGTGNFDVNIYPFLQTLGDQYTVFLVAKFAFPSGISSVILALYGQPLSIGYYTVYPKREIGFFNVNFGSTIDVPRIPLVSDSSPFVYSARVDSTAPQKLRVLYNGILSTTISTAASPGFVEPATDLFRVINSSEFLELIVYNRVLTDEENEKMTRYLASKWGCGGPLFGYSI